jgi:hypothetical protein
MRSAIGGQSLDQIARWRPRALTQDCDQRYQSGSRLDAGNVDGNMQRALPRNLLLDLRINRQSEVEVQCLKIPGFTTVQPAG